MATTKTVEKRVVLYAKTGTKVTVGTGRVADYVKRGYSKAAPKTEAPAPAETK